jgi:8-oxo-dGTP diphosphatase
MNFETATPRIASYILLRKDGKIAFVLRQNTNWMDNFYGLPSGKIEKKEAAMAAVIREGNEEVGVTLTPDQIRFVHVMHRQEETDWVDFYFEADDYEGEAYNAEPHMHAELAWLDPDNLPDNVIPSVRFALDEIKAGRTFSEYGF